MSTKLFEKGSGHRNAMLAPQQSNMEDPRSGSRRPPRAKSSSQGSAVWSSVGIIVAVLSLARSAPWLLASSFTNSRTSELQRRLDDSSTTVENAGVWAGLAVAAMLMKLTASTDDVVWLLPFVSGGHKRRNAFFYLFCMQLVVFISWGFCAGGEKLLGLFMPEDPDWPLARILELMSAILLTVYTVKLFWEWWQERHGDDDRSDEQAEEAAPTEVDHSGEKQDQGSEESLSDTTCPVPTPSSSKSGEDDPLGAEQVQMPFPPSEAAAPTPAAKISASPQTDDEAGVVKVEAASAQEDVSKEKHTLGKLFTISMFGSLDDFAVFVSLMLSGVLSAGHLAVGVFLGSIIVVTVCVGAGLFVCVVQVVEKIPLWCIIGAFAIWTYISAFVMEH